MGIVLVDWRFVRSEVDFRTGMGAGNDDDGGRSSGRLSPVIICGGRESARQTLASKWMLANLCPTLHTDEADTKEKD